MADRTRTLPKRFRIWPGVVFPLGLTLLLALAGWQFVTGVTAEQERRNDAAAALASYARMEAGELSRRAQTLAQSFTDNRLASRAEQEKNLRVEIRGVMEAVNRVLGASLERNRAQTAARREVPGFPSGFESIKNYLELSRAGGEQDHSVKALHACAPELNNLLPAGCSLAVIENNAVEIFSIGGGAPQEDSLSVAMNREFVWSEGAGEGKRWTLLLKLHAPDRYSVPQAAEIAEYLTNEMGSTTLENAVWRGWLVDAGGQPAATFPLAAEGTGADQTQTQAQVRTPQSRPLPFTGRPGEWVEIDEQTQIWLESSPRQPGQEIAPLVAVSIEQPAPPLDLVEEFTGDTRWVCTLGALALGAMGFWIWFMRNMFSGRRRRIAELEVMVAPVSAPAKPRQRTDRERGADRPASVSAGMPSTAAGSNSTASAGAAAVSAELRRRLVRDEAATRAVPDVEDVIVADITPDGGMTVSPLRQHHPQSRLQTAEPPRPVMLPSGSLFRLQAQHRGGKSRPGSRALDRATHPVLKTLAARIRPAVNANASHKILSARSNTTAITTGET